MRIFILPQNGKSVCYYREKKDLTIKTKVFSAYQYFVFFEHESHHYLVYELENGKWHVPPFQNMPAGVVEQIKVMENTREYKVA